MRQQRMSDSSRQLTIFSEQESAEVADAVPQYAPPTDIARDLWMAVWLPHLALDTLAQTGTMQTDPLLISENPVSPRVHDANRAARRAGVRVGMPLADALAILSAPRVIEYAEQSTVLQLQTLASILLQFSDHVAPQAPQPCVLLEVGRSLRLFGGIDALRAKVAQTLRQLGYSVRLGLAATPAAARVLAQTGNVAIPRDRASLRQVIGRISLAALPPEVLQGSSFRDMGLQRIGDLYRLPREDLALRYGAGLLHTLDQWLGVKPEVVHRFEPPETPSLRLDFDHEITTTGALRFPLKRLLLQLEQVLRSRQQGVQRLDLHLLHHAGESHQVLECGEPTGSAQRWLELWMLRLAVTQLSAPVRGMRLRVTALLPLGGRAGRLLPGITGDAGSMQNLVARLRARLGPQAVQWFEPTLQPLPEDAQIGVHPEGTQASRLLPKRYPTESQKVAGSALWLRPLQPYREISGAQWVGRLEGGWWARGQDQRRDYALVRDANGRLCWVFRELRSGQWQLQGYWG